MYGWVCEGSLDWHRSGEGEESDETNGAGGAAKRAGGGVSAEWKARAKAGIRMAREMKVSVLG